MWQRAKAAIRAAFIEHMGAEVADAAALRWPESDVPPYARMPISDPEAFARNLTDEELQAEMDAREDWRDRLIAERELERRRWPQSVRWGLLALGLLMIALAAWDWGWI